jgi:hypothetical protein
VALGLLVLFVVAACGSWAAVPPDSAPPAVVLEAYLVALRSGDCDTADALAAPTFVVGNRELCGALHVTAFGALTAPAIPRDGEVVSSTPLAIAGGDASMPDGEHLWFYTLDRQPNGAWRLAGGGSGP